MQNDKKKILFVCQYFYPEVFRGNDIAFHLAEEGHEVHVATGIPNYPAGKFHDGYGLFKNRHEIINPSTGSGQGSVKVTRLPIFPRGDNKIMLMLNYFSYYIVACVWMLLHAIGHKYDMVFCQQLSPVMMSAPAVLYKKLRHVLRPSSAQVPLYLWVLDIYSESIGCIRTSTERHEAMDKGCFIIAGIDEKNLLQAVDTAVEMNQDGRYGIPVPVYREDVSTKVVKIIQSYTGVVNKMVWRK